MSENYATGDLSYTCLCCCVEFVDGPDTVCDHCEALLLIESQAEDLYDWLSIPKWKLERVAKWHAWARISHPSLFEAEDDALIAAIREHLKAGERV